jgi:hypothetical protein
MTGGKFQTIFCRCYDMKKTPNYLLPLLWHEGNPKIPSAGCYDKKETPNYLLSLLLYKGNSKGFSAVAMTREKLQINFCHCYETKKTLNYLPSLLWHKVNSKLFSVVALLQRKLQTAVGVAGGKFQTIFCRCYDTRETPNYLLPLLWHEGKPKIPSAGCYDKKKTPNYLLSLLLYRGNSKGSSAVATTRGKP